MMASRSIIVGLVALASTLGCGASRAQSIEALYEQAKAEKTLVLYAAGPTEPHERFAKEFQQRFPGLTVALTGGFSNALNEAINQQIKDKKVTVDMAFFQTVQDFVTWKTQGKLLAFKQDQILPNFRDEDGAYLALSATRLLMPTIPPGSARRILRNRRRIFSSRCLRAR